MCVCIYIYIYMSIKILKPSRYYGMMAAHFARGEVRGEVLILMIIITMIMIMMIVMIIVVMIVVVVVVVVLLLMIMMIIVIMIKRPSRRAPRAARSWSEPGGRGWHPTSPERSPEHIIAIYAYSGVRQSYSRSPTTVVYFSVELTICNIVASSLVWILFILVIMSFSKCPIITG